MNNPASVTPQNPPPETRSTPILDRLPDYVGDRGCTPRIQQQIDLLLLTIEAVELGGAERMLATIAQLGLQPQIPNRVALWRLRCTNPWRRSYARRTLSIAEAKALVLVIHYRAKQLTVPIRQLVLAKQQMRDQELPLEKNIRLARYLDRFRAHFRARMNPRRVKVTEYVTHPEQLEQLALSLLDHLLFCTGTAGERRLWSSLFDGEIK